MFYQRTIEKEINFSGIGLHTGKLINVSLKPLESDNGIIFYRKDLGYSVKLEPNNIINTTLATTIGIPNILNISTIEHFLSILYITGIDNLLIEINGEEMPILDGSAYPYFVLIKSAGIKTLSKSKVLYKLKKEVIIKENDKFIRMIPNNQLIFDITIDFPGTIIGKENIKFKFNSIDFVQKISKARTFGFVKDIKYLKSKGLAQGGDLTNAIIIDNNRILNDSLRMNKEFVKHKLLDLIGDLYTFNNIIIGKVESYKTGHKLNNQIIKEIYNNKELYLEKILLKNIFKKESLKKDLNLSFLV